jgi:hypothetical protein
MRVRKILSGSTLSVAAVVGISAAVYAAASDSTNFTQQIGAGVISSFIGDASGAEVTSPSVAFSNVSVSNAVQTSTGTLGTNSERVYVDNPSGANSGWTVTLAATGGPSAKWTAGGNQYSYNGASSANGQLTVDPSVGTITMEVGTNTGITKGSSATYNSGTSSITLLTASAGSDDINRLYLTGVGLSQTIPASTPPGSYQLDFTETVTAS